MTRFHVLVLALCSATACTPVLRFTRPVAPEGSFGPVRVLGIEVATDMKEAVKTSILTGLVLGEIPIPVPVNTVLENQLTRTLQRLGYSICAAPCGEATLVVRLTESSVNTELTRSGPYVNVRLTARLVLQRPDGSSPFDFSYWSRRSGPAPEAGLLVQGAAEGIAGSLERSLLPGRLTTTLPLEDGGPLTRGVNQLLSGNLDGALTTFSDLTAQQPQLAGAWYDLGVTLEARGDEAQALGAYERAAGLERKGRYLDAVDATRRAVQPAR